MMTDTIADMLTRIRNAQMAKKRSLEMPYSKIKFAIAEILKQENYLVKVEKKEDGKFPQLALELKYSANQPAIQNIKRESKPGHRQYRKSNELPKILNGYGIAIVSTSQGLMTAKKAKELGIGGELVCSIY